MITKALPSSNYEVAAVKRWQDRENRKYLKMKKKKLGFVLREYDGELNKIGEVIHRSEEKQ